MNDGTPTSPSFLSPVASSYGDASVAGYRILSVEIVDLDADGDEDLLLGTVKIADETPHVFYYENTSTEEGPSFGGRQTDPFGIMLPGANWTDNNGGPGIAAADLDDDGDIDLLIGPRTTNPYYGAHYANFYFFENAAITAE